MRAGGTQQVPGLLEEKPSPPCPRPSVPCPGQGPELSCAEGVDVGQVVGVTGVGASHGSEEAEPAEAVAGSVIEVEHHHVAAGVLGQAYPEWW